MKRAAIALALTLLAVPATAQVEIRGLTIAAPDKPGNGGIMLKGVISTRLPGNISELIALNSNSVRAVIDGKSYRLVLRDGQLVQELESAGGHPFVATMNLSADLDGDGKPETARFHKTSSGWRLAILTQAGTTSWTEIGSIDGLGTPPLFEFADLTRSDKLQIIAVSGSNNCLRVTGIADRALKEIGTLSCGAPLIASPTKADIDNDGRYDLIVARQPDRIEIFLR